MDSLRHWRRRMHHWLRGNSCCTTCRTLCAPIAASNRKTTSMIDTYGLGTPVDPSPAEPPAPAPAPAPAQPAAPPSQSYDIDIYIAHACAPPNAQRTPVQQLSSAAVLFIFSPTGCRYRQKTRSTQISTRCDPPPDSRFNLHSSPIPRVRIKGVSSGAGGCPYRT